MKNLLILIALLPLIGYGQCPIGQSQVTIKVKTDSYGYETYWQLVPGGNSCGNGTIFIGGNTAVGCNGGGAQAQHPGGYGNNITITEGPWCLTNGDAYDIIYVDDYGDGGAIFDVLINGFPIYTGLTGLGKNPYSKLSFTVTPALAYDFQGEKINTYSYVNPGNVDVKATFFSRSSDTINSLNFNYRIDNNSVVTQAIGAQTILPFTNITYTHSTQWNAVGSGTYTVTAWLSNLNGNLDMNLNNDMVSKAITVGPSIPNIIDNYIGAPPLKTIIAGTLDGILVPRDLDFNPNLSKNELWIVLKSTEASGGKTAKISNAGLPNQSVLVQQDGNAWHFMSLPTGIAFSDNGNFSTSPGVLDANHGMGSPFTGPALWSSDPAIYAQPSGGNGSHIDMLHESPYSMGIAYESENAFWINDGYHNTAVRYDFEVPHLPGGSDHSDGIIRQYSGLGLLMDPTQNVVSHLIFDKATGWLYIVDTGNDRIVRLNTATGNFTGNLTPHETVAEYSYYSGYTSADFINIGLTEPSGIDLIGNRLLVSDHSNGEIVIYDLTGSTGTELGRIQTGAPGIMGIKIGPDGRIWYVNATTNEVVRLEPTNFTSIQEIQNTTNFSMSPNPTSNLMNIEAIGVDGGISNVSIYNTLGEPVYIENVPNVDKLQINTSQWSKGMYTVQVTHKNRIRSKKLIIN